MHGYAKELMSLSLSLSLHGLNLLLGVVLLPAIRNMHGIRVSVPERFLCEHSGADAGAHLLLLTQLRKELHISSALALARVCV